jgi:hypothetical protein
MTHDQIIALLDEHDPGCPVRAIQAGGGFWSATVKDDRPPLGGPI